MLLKKCNSQGKKEKEGMRKSAILVLIFGFLFSCSETGVLTRNINDFGKPVYFKEPKYLTNSKTISKIKANEIIYKRETKTKGYNRWTNQTIYSTVKTKIRSSGFLEILNSTSLMNSWYLISNISAGYQANSSGVNFSNTQTNKFRFFLKGVVEIKE